MREENVVSREESCSSCKHFEGRTRFCRLKPPQPIMFLSSEGNHISNDPSYCSSKFPTISKPDLDYCSYWKSGSVRILNEQRNI